MKQLHHSAKIQFKSVDVSVPSKAEPDNNITNKEGDNLEWYTTQAN